jgi:uncharacterized repeat protein (TIGR03803 family)
MQPKNPALNQILISSQSAHVEKTMQWRQDRPTEDCPRRSIEMKQVGRVLTMAVALLGFGAYTAAAQETLLYSFTSGSAGPDASGPGASLISDAEGNLYGTTQLGGAKGEGTAFELSPAVGGGWTEKVIYSFGQCPQAPCSGASEPEGSLIFDAQGNLYGTTESGGPGGEFGGRGTVFELSPGAGGVWTETTLYEFGAAAGDGTNPVAALIFDGNGNLYGTTESGGANGKGAVFELSPGVGGVWTEKLLYSFAGPAANPPDGQDPTGNLIFDAQGNIYGTTFTGGKNDTAGEGGTVFELLPGAGGVWTEKVLYNFGGALSPDGNQPTAALIFDAEGNLYGTTREGGGSLDGTVFELSPAAGGTWTESLLHNFIGAPSDGAVPYCTLFIDAQGNLYGTTKYGGPNNFALDPDVNYLGSGMVFELTPGGGGGWTESILYNFNATGSDGTVPEASLIPDTAGNLYSTTTDGGTTGNASVIGDGSVFEIGATGLPAFSPAGGNYGVTQSVTITSATAGSAIYYTTNGTTPTTSSTKYTGPIAVSDAETIEAFAAIAGSPNSAVASATYTFQLQTAATPVISPTAGTYASTQSVTITDSTAGATIYYTTNGTPPSASSTQYSGAISVTATETIEAIAVANGFSNSSVASAAYTINLPAAAAPTFSPAVGTYSSAQSVTLTDSTAGAAIYYTTDGTTPSASSTLYAGAITVSSTETIEAIAIAGGFSNSAVASGTYTINLPGATPVISPAGGTYASAQSVTITDSTAGATIYYTTNGTTPTASSTVYSGAISVSSTETIEAIATANGFSNSAVASAAYTINLAAAATPVISPAAGTYSSAQSVTITDATAGAIIYYTTNGTMPTASSTQYSGAISVSSTETIEAIAIASGFSNSAAATAAYTINLAAAATPVISPAAGTYSSTQSVTITDATTGAAIYYTTNGTTPTASSTVYTGAIPVSASETIEAIATASGFSSSATASAAYVIQVVAPSYALSANPSSLTIKRGSTGTTVITLTPTGGFTGTVNFACGTLPSEVTCNFAPSSLTVPSAGALTTTLTVGTTGTAMASLGDGPKGTFLPEVFVAMILLPLGFTRRMLRARKGGSPWLMGLLLLATASLAAAGMAGISGCGGGRKTTPAGNYTVPIEVTSGGTTVPLSLSITVQ